MVTTRLVVGGSRSDVTGPQKRAVSQSSSVSPRATSAETAKPKREESVKKFTRKGFFCYVDSATADMIKQGKGVPVAMVEGEVFRGAGSGAGEPMRARSAELESAFGTSSHSDIICDIVRSGKRV